MPQSQQKKAIMAKIRWSKIMPLNSHTMKLLQNKSGIYEIFDSDMNRIYVGHSNIIKHRDESYLEIDDFKVHPTKEPLRSKEKFIRVSYMPLKDAEAHEKIIKQSLPYNMDSHTHEREKKK